jgi:predicted nicotinamide N-methyase
MYIAAGQNDADPYWAILWPSAVSLASILLEEPELVAGARVCDLGAGLGLGGIGAALAGAREVGT